MTSPRPIRIAILGSTGSIGTQTLDVVRRLHGRVEVIALAAHRNTDLLLQQAREFRPIHVCVADETTARQARIASNLPQGTALHTGRTGMVCVASLPEVDTVVVAVAGAIGIEPTHAAIQAGKRIALASKEVLVAAGQHTMDLARHHGVPVVPIDSEHSALFQCLQGARREDVDKLILTASGGPFRNASLDELRSVTPDQALSHPTWNMGGLVTINSATLMNKGLEIIEACRLFDVPPERVEVVVHPQSIVHSLVRFRDGSVLAQLGLPDMRLPIQYALLYPDRVDTNLPRLDLTTTAPLTFAPPDPERFPALSLARRALEAGGTMPAAMNAANEAAVDLFLKRRLPFLGIIELVATVMEEHVPETATFSNVLKTDAWARRMALESIQGRRELDGN